MTKKPRTKRRADANRPGRPKASATVGMITLCEEWVELLRRRRETPARIRKAAARLRALARDVRAGKRSVPGDLELREIAAVLAELSPASGRPSTEEDDAAIAHRGLQAWTESAAAEDWSAFYPPKLRRTRRAQ